MDSDAPAASWHPAMMPNSAADAIADDAGAGHPQLPPSPPAPPHAHNADDNADAAEPATAGQAETTGGRDAPPEDDSGFDNWVSEEGDAADKSWLDHHDQPGGAPLEEEESKDTDGVHPEEDAEPAHDDIGGAPVALSTAAKHFSTVSFARTVSYDVSWDGDDDDQEWTLSRTDTDPFKFMPPPSHTNSFPVVPPAEHNVEQPSPSSQAEHLMSEAEHEREDGQAGSGSNPAFPPPTSHHDLFSGGGEEGDHYEPHQYVGGDLQDTVEEASHARYAEGVPLIPHEEETNCGAADPEGNKPDLFADEARGDDDDLFGNIGGSGATVSEESDPVPGLERKSTMQVIGSLGSKSTGYQNIAMQEALEGEDGDDEHLGRQREEETQRETGHSGVPVQDDPSEDLAAKWEQAFAGDDDDDDFLLEDSPAESKELDPAAFFGDDDEGFLEDTEDQPAAAPATTTTTTTPAPALEPKAQNGRYLPPQQPQPPTSSNPYQPVPNSQQPPFPTPSFAAPTSAPPMNATQYGAPYPELGPSKGDSFVDKGKSGYQSPYDLPMDLVKQPRKRQTMQQMPRTTTAPAAPQVAPPGGSGGYGQGPPPSRGSVDSMSPPTSSHSQQGGARLMTKPKESFFEELPMSNKVRPASRTSQMGLASSPQNTLFAPPQQPGPPQTSGFGQPLLTPPPTAPPPHQQQQQYAPSQPAASDASRLVAPERVSPYAPLHSNASMPNLPPAPMNARYSPAPPTTNGVVPPPAAPSRYSPAPSRSSSSGGYGAIGGSPLPPALPHQPRTSSPLAHFGITHDRPKLSPSPMGGDTTHSSDRRSTSSMYEPRLMNRVPSLPPTREVDEEDGAAGPEPPQNQPLTPSPELRFSQMPHHHPQQTPPPAAQYASATLSPPPKHSAAPNYTPQGASTSSPAKQHAPPQRSQTQSPGSAYGKAPAGQTTEPVRRPSSSVYDPPTSSTAAAVAAAPPSRASRPRGISQSLNMVPPTDGHELDPLQRWTGAPVISWGVGGVMVASFPQSVPRYGMNQAMPQILRSPGEVKIKNIKELQPLEERLAKFPGPLKGKSKKKETVAWLTTGIEALERNLPNLAFQTHVSHEDKRAVERVLLWKILRLFVEHDGILEGNPAVEKAVRDVLSPGLDGRQCYPRDASAGRLSHPGAATLAPGLQTSSSLPEEIRADSVDWSTMEQIRNSLLTGDREAAVWTAADRRLWGHALLIANTVSPDLYKKVAQEFVRKEVNNATGHNESLAALYEVLAGNHDECVDELVPVHARAGLQLMQTSTASGAARLDAMEGLDKWKETLGLILSNRSTGDTRALNSLGNLLSGYGRAEAAHICFLFAQDAAVFGGLDDPRSSFVLVGSDHKRQAEQFAKETEALLLSEVYEYGLTLSGAAPAVAAGSPHLAAYKLQHALTLAEYGHRDKAMAYCDAIAAAMTAQTRRSPYHHVILEAAVDDLATRLKQAPKEGSNNSWIPKPSMNRVSSSVWDRFNKFVAGDETDGGPAPGGANAARDVSGASGPFAHISGGTPTISRPPSSVGATTGMEMFGGGGSPAYAQPNGGVGTSPPAITRAASRYAPAAARGSSATSTGGYEPTTTSSSSYAPMGRTSGETSRSSLDHQPRQGADLSSTTGNPHAPVPVPAQGQGFPDAGLGISHESSYMPDRQTAPSSPPYAPPVQPPAGSASPGYYGPYGPPQGLGSPYAPISTAQTTQDAPAEAENNADAAASGYQAPSYGYEQPPSMSFFEPPSMSPFQPPSISTYEPPSTETSGEAPGGGYEPPSYQPYGYEPPSYNPDPEPMDEDDGSDSASKPKPKKKSFMDDDDDDIPALRAQPMQAQTKAEKDRENEEMFRRIAEDEAKRDREAKAGKKSGGWGLGGWFGGGGGAKKDASLDNPPNKPIRAKLGEASSFYYDPELKRWVNKKAGAGDAGPKTATPPPPRAATSTPPASSATPPPPMGGRGRSAPPMHGLDLGASVPDLKGLSAQDGGVGGLVALPPGAPPAMARSASTSSAPDGGPGVPATAGGGPPSSGPPSRPATSMSNASSIDDLLGAPAPRKAGGAKKARKSGRYVDVMAK